MCEGCDTPRGGHAPIKTKTWIRTTALALLVAAGALGASGCTEAKSHEVAGTLAGGALGAGAGAIIGNQTGHTGTGTAIGAGAGALAGNLIGRGIDEAARSNERNSPPAGYTYPPSGASYPSGYASPTYNAPPGAPPPPPPPGHRRVGPDGAAVDLALQPVVLRRPPDRKSPGPRGPGLHYFGAARRLRAPAGG